MRSRTVRTEPHCPRPTLAARKVFEVPTHNSNPGRPHTWAHTGRCFPAKLKLCLEYLGSTKYWQLQMEDILCKGIKKELTMGQLQTTCLFPMTIFLWKIGQGWWLWWRWRRWWRGRSRWSSFETEAGLKKCKERQLNLKLQRPKLKWNDNGLKWNDNGHVLNCVSKMSLFWLIEAWVGWWVQCAVMWSYYTDWGRKPEK